jgi:hypothetical protein
MHRSLSVAAVVVAIVLLAACGPATSPSSEASSAASVEASTEASATPGETPANDGGSGLADLLPGEIGGITLTKEFHTGTAFFGSSGIEPAVQDFLDRVGASVNDVSIASATGSDQTDPQNPRYVSIFAIRVAGVDEGRLRDEYRTVLEADTTITDANVGGKSVLADPATPDHYVYVKSDIIFQVSGSPSELATQALSALP